MTKSYNSYYNLHCLLNIIRYSVFWCWKCKFLGLIFMVYYLNLRENVHNSRWFDPIFFEVWNIGRTYLGKWPQQLNFSILVICSWLEWSLYCFNKNVVKEKAQLLKSLIFLFKYYFATAYNYLGVFSFLSADYIGEINIWQYFKFNFV